MMRALFLVLLFGTAHADVYKSTDSSGRILFSDKSSEGAKKLDIPSPPAKIPEKNEEERPVPEKAGNAEEEKLKALQKRLDAEISGLDAVKAELKKVRDAISGTDRNSQEDIDKASALEDEIARREKTVEDLRKSISGQ